MLWHNYRTSIIIAAVFTLTLSTFWLFPQLAFIIFISMLLQLILAPFTEFLARRLPHTLAAGLILLSFIGIMTGILTVVSQTVIPTFTNFVTDLPRISDNIRQLPFINDSPFIASEFSDLSKELTSFSIDALKSSLTILVSIFSKFIDVVVILFVTFYLLKDGAEIKVFIASLFPAHDYTRVMQLFNRILDSLRIYICSQLIICCITATIVFLYFTLRGLPYASVFALISGVAEFIPVLGPTIASAFGTILTATQTPWLTLQTLAFYIILTQTNHNFIYPTLIGKSLNLHPIAIILGIILGGEVLGAAGMFLAVPFIVIIKLVIEDIYHDRIATFEKRKKSCR
jgi:predicted PurR-regulated permease PerM